MTTRCAGCGGSPTDRAHIKSRGAGGGDEESNVVALCRRCHQRQHQVGWSKFMAERPAVADALDRKGWEVRDVLGVEKLVRRA
jgi:hypothetical protein